MLKNVLAACAVLCALTVSADARPRHALTYAAHPDCNVTMPCEGVIVSPRGERIVKQMGGLGSARKQYTPRRIPRGEVRAAPQVFAGGSSIARPSRYVSGRLICAINVNAALAERGIPGTGSAVAKSFLSWGMASAPVPGAVAVSCRRGGGHVAIVKEVKPDGTIIVWNPSPRGRGWQEAVYRHRAISFRVPG